ncbi:MAG: aminodeoxychorismate synthase component I [Pseudomonadota bacterium]
MDRLLFDAGPVLGGSLFAAPWRIIRADRFEDVPDAFAQMETARAAGSWLAGYASYELGYSYSHKLRDLCPEGGAPYLLFGVFDAPEPAPELVEGPSSFSMPEPLRSEADYARAFARLREYIAAGDVYQANLTFPLTARYKGTAEALYAKLRARQPAPHGVLVELDGVALLSRSPELFFSLDAERQLKARPMKGTAARGEGAAEDAAQVHWLRNSVKNRAENLMIVDLLRNDMSRVSEVGTVRVPHLYSIETYDTLHQMTSTVTSRLRDDVGLAELFEGLFPCGSITGAPKIRSMQIIAELEQSARGPYCGAIGWVSPEGAMEFNVAIRTIELMASEEARLNVGGGVVYDSEAGAEYAEALLKARYAEIG